LSFTGNFACNSFKTGLMGAAFNFTSGVYYIALYTNAASLDQNTTAYTPIGEVIGTGYIAGGSVLTISTVPTNLNNTTYISFSNISWSGALTARGALIYKAGVDGAVCVLDFGADKTSLTGLTIQFPATGATTSIIRLT